MQKFIIALALVVGVLGADAHAMSIFDQSKRIEALESEIGRIKGRDDAIAELLRRTMEKQDKQEKLIQSIEGRQQEGAINSLEVARLSETFPAFTSFNPTKKQFHTIATKYGIIAVYCSDVKKYASGTEVKLSFINFYSIAIAGIDITIKYSTVNINDVKTEDLPERYNEFLANMHISRDKIESLFPGRESVITVSMPEIKPEDLKYISVELAPSGIRYIGK